MRTRFINEGATEIARRTECLRATSPLATVAGTAVYSATLPTTLLRINMAYYAPPSSTQKFPLEFADQHALDRMWGTHMEISQGVPAFFTTWGYTPLLNVRLYPIPNGAGTLYLYYSKLPTAVVDATPTGVIDLPNGWEDVVLDWVEYKCYLTDNQIPRATEALRMFDQHLMALHEASIRFVDQPGNIVPDMFGAGYMTDWG